MQTYVKKAARSPLATVLRVLVSVALLAIVLSRLRVQETFALLTSVRWQWLLGTLGIYLIAEVISGRRWQILLRAQDANVRLPSLLQALIIGRFFNQFMISTIGGDTTRFWLSARLTGKPLDAGVVLVADRVIGLLALLLVAAVGTVIGARFYPNLLSWQLIAVGGFLFGALCFYLLLHESTAKRLSRWLPTRLNPLVTTLRQFRTRSGALPHAFALSLLLQLVVVARYYTLARAVDITISPLLFPVLIPVALLVLVIPITVNGLGLREVTFISLFGVWGVAATQSTAFAWLDLAFGLFIAAIGGLFFMFKR
jgi:uncharacterized protein (TIRG00374 family)